MLKSIFIFLVVIFSITSLMYDRVAFGQTVAQLKAKHCKSEKNQSYPLAVVVDDRLHWCNGLKMRPKRWRYKGNPGLVTTTQGKIYIDSDTSIRTKETWVSLKNFNSPWSLANFGKQIKHPNWGNDTLYSIHLQAKDCKKNRKYNYTSCPGNALQHRKISQESTSVSNGKTTASSRVEPITKIVLVLAETTGGGTVCRNAGNKRQRDRCKANRERIFQRHIDRLIDDYSRRSGIQFLGAFAQGFTNNEKNKVQWLISNVTRCGGQYSHRDRSSPYVYKFSRDYVGDKGLGFILTGEFRSDEHLHPLAEMTASGLANSCSGRYGASLAQVTSFDLITLSDSWINDFERKTSDIDSYISHTKKGKYFFDKPSLLKKWMKKIIARSGWVLQKQDKISGEIIENIFEEYSLIRYRWKFERSMSLLTEKITRDDNRIRIEVAYPGEYIVSVGKNKLYREIQDDAGEFEFEVSAFRSLFRSDGAYLLSVKQDKGATWQFSLQVEGTQEWSISPDQATVSVNADVNGWMVESYALCENESQGVIPLCRVSPAVSQLSAGSHEVYKEGQLKGYLQIAKSTINTSNIQFSLVQGQLHITGQGQFYTQTAINLTSLDGECNRVSDVSFSCDISLSASELIFFPGKIKVQVADRDFGEKEYILSVPLGFGQRLGALSWTIWLLLGIMAVLTVTGIIFFMAMLKKGKANRIAKRQVPRFERVTQYEVSYS